MSVFYNDVDPFCCSWLNHLIADGLIAPGHVDNRSIADIQPEDLEGYTQCHFFAGIGVFSAALRLAGWDDDRSCWTGSCPCQSFSSAGKRKGFADERHLWPEWYRLISACRPPIIFGEQIWSAGSVGRKRRAPEPTKQCGLFGCDSGETQVEDSQTWFDLVQANLETASYTVGAVGTPAAGFGAPHIRQRLYFCGVALGDSNVPRPQGRPGVPERADKLPAGTRSMVGGLPNAMPAGWAEGRTIAGGGSVAGVCGSSGLSHTHGERLDRQQVQLQSGQPGHADTETTGNGGLSGLADPEAALRRRAGAEEHGRRGSAEAGGSGEPVRLAVTPELRRDGDHPQSGSSGAATEAGRPERDTKEHQRQPAGGCEPCGLAHSSGIGVRAEGRRQDAGAEGGVEGQGLQREWDGAVAGDVGANCRPSPTNGLWANPDWLLCRDGKWRPTEPTIFPLAPTGTFCGNRVGLLRGAGNSLCIAQAQGFVESVMEVLA